MTEDEFKNLILELQKIIDNPDLYLDDDMDHPNPGTLICRRCGKGEDELSESSCIEYLLNIY